MRGVRRGQEAGVAKPHPLQLLEVCVENTWKISIFCCKIAESIDNSGHIGSSLQYSLPLMTSFSFYTLQSGVWSQLCLIRHPGLTAKVQ